MSEKLVLLVLLGIVVGMLHVIAFWRRKAGEAAYAAARSASREDERGRYCRMAVMAGHRDACRMFCCMYPDRFDDRHPLKPFKFRGIIRSNRSSSVESGLHFTTITIRHGTMIFSMKHNGHSAVPSTGSSRERYTASSSSRHV